MENLAILFRYNEGTDSFRGVYKKSARYQIADGITFEGCETVENNLPALWEAYQAALATDERTIYMKAHQAFAAEIARIEAILNS